MWGLGIILQKPFRLVVGGPSGSGKTSFVQTLVDNDFFETSFDKIIFNYPDYLEEVPTEFSSTVEYKQGLVDQEYLHNLGENVLLIIDDMGSLLQLITFAWGKILLIKPI